MWEKHLIIYSEQEAASESRVATFHFSVDHRSRFYLEPNTWGTADRSRDKEKGDRVLGGCGGGRFLMGHSSSQLMQIQDKAGKQIHFHYSSG